MGENKAFLTYAGRNLVQRAAAAVASAAGDVTVIGNPSVYAFLGYPVIPDRLPGCGPLAGIETALANTRAEWNLIVACDMPALDPALLNALCDAAEEFPNEADSLVPQSRDGRLQPLCAVYHRGCLPSVEAALARGERTVTSWVRTLRTRLWPAEELSCFQNVNTPAEWIEFLKLHPA